METDIGNPIEYDPSIDPLHREINEDKPDEQYYFQPPEMSYPQQHYMPPQEKFDFASVDKSTWIIAFAVFLLGFFMGKTMQPVILRYTWVPNKWTNVPIPRGDEMVNKWSSVCIFNKTSGCTHILLHLFFVF